MQLTQLFQQSVHWSATHLQFPLLPFLPYHSKMLKVMISVDVKQMATVYPLSSMLIPFQSPLQSLSRTPHLIVLLGQNLRLCPSCIHSQHLARVHSSWDLPIPTNPARESLCIGCGVYHQLVPNLQCLLRCPGLLQIQHSLNCFTVCCLTWFLFSLFSACQS